MAKMGFDTFLHKLTDVLSIEPWAVRMIHQPLAAVMMLYTLTDVQEEYCWNEQVTPTSDNVWFIQECMAYVCGTIGLLHALLNAPKGVRTVMIHPSSWLHFFTRTVWWLCLLLPKLNDWKVTPQSKCYMTSLHAINICTRVWKTVQWLSPATKAEQLEGDSTIKTLHYKVASDESNETSCGSLEDEAIGHFITMVYINGGLYKLDGQKDGPVQHSDTTQETLLENACKVVEKFMKCDPNEMHFTIMALVPKTD